MQAISKKMVGALSQQFPPIKQLIVYKKIVPNLIICPNIFPSIFLINTIAKLERSKMLLREFIVFY